MTRALLVALLVIAPGRVRAQASDEAPVEAPRSVHVRSHVATHGALAIPLGASGWLAGAGIATGVEIAVHPNHDLGVRGWATWLPYDSEPYRRWQTHFSPQVMLMYRFHDDVRSTRPAVYLELGIGIGGYDGCLNGDFCGGFGLAAEVGGGIELAFHRYFALVAGAQVIAQTGMVNGVSLVLVPSLTVGARAG